MATPTTGQRLGLTSACCPNSVSAPLAGHSMSVWEPPIQLVNGIFIHLQLATSGSRIANTTSDLQIASEELAMLGELMNIPTDTLIDMLYIILAGDFVITANDAAEIEQIERELQRRDEEQHWRFQAVN
jgi:hypothetical protein